ncbi:MAG: glycosyltransferase 87 family protein [Chloroflexi bacterium]|nr:glycosyltransferase 87 family protein [Chloroflexota bacterium]
MTAGGAPAAARRTPPLLVAAAVVVPVLTTAVILLVAGDTLGYDFRAYLDAARRLLDGAPLYESGVTVSGGVGLFQYPPPFALALVPLALLPGTLAPTLAWLALSLAALAAGIAALPVRPWVRWTVLLVAGLTWPVLYAVKLGQVGPVLLLLFALRVGGDRRGLRGLHPLRGAGRVGRLRRARPRHRRDGGDTARSERRGGAPRHGR